MPKKKQLGYKIRASRAEPMEAIPECCPVAKVIYKEVRSTTRPRWSEMLNAKGEVVNSEDEETDEDMNKDMPGLVQEYEDKEDKPRTHDKNVIDDWATKFKGTEDEHGPRQFLLLRRLSVKTKRATCQDKEHSSPPPPPSLPRGLPDEIPPPPNRVPEPDAHTFKWNTAFLMTLNWPYLPPSQGDIYAKEDDKEAKSSSDPY